MPSPRLRSSSRTFQTSVWFGQIAFSRRGCRRVDLYLLGDGAQHRKCVIKMLTTSKNVSDVSYYAK